MFDLAGLANLTRMYTAYLVGRINEGEFEIWGVYDDALRAGNWCAARNTHGEEWFVIPLPINEEYKEARIAEKNGYYPSRFKLRDVQE